MTAEAEIVVVGAGPAGATVARLLAEAGRDVLLLHAAPRPVDRLEILPPGASPLLAALGLEPLLDEPDIATPCLGIRRRWLADRTETEDFLRRPGAGYILNRLHFDVALRGFATRAGVRTIPDARLLGAREEDDGLRLTCSAGPIRARFAVDASGRAAMLARRLGARRITGPALFALRKPADTAVPGWLGIEATATGWEYEVAAPAGHRDSWRLQGRPAPGALLAGMARLDRAAGRRWLAIGDAAAAFDPLASQGLWQALASALSAADALLGHPALRDAAFEAHAARIGTSWDTTRHGLREVYRGAARFARAPFWRRMGAADPIAPS